MKIRMVLAAVCLLLPRMSLAESGVVITEVMANPVSEDQDEFIELYNASGAAVDLAGWQVTDGDALDTIVAWDPAMHGVFTDPDAVTGTTVLAARQLAVVFDSEYLAGEKPYDVPAGTVVLTIANTTLGNGLTSTDPITLYDASRVIVSTYGTPVLSDDWHLADDNGLDGIPFDPGNGLSVERVDAALADVESNWVESPAESGATPGALYQPAVAPDEPDEPDEPEVPEDNPDEKEHDQPDVPDEDNAPDTNDTEDDDAPDDNDPDSTQGEYRDDVKINEVLPNPDGSDDAEFIELANHGDHDVDLTGWVIADGAREYTLREGVARAGDVFLLLRSTTGLALNNSGEEVVELRDPRGEVKDHLEYSGSEEGESFALIDGEWVWTQPTPGKANVLSESRTIEDEREEEAKKDSGGEEEKMTRYDFSDRISLSEIMVNPVGPDEDGEWIELVNRDTRDVDLVGWTVTDTKVFYRIEESLVIRKGRWVALERSQTGIALNNSKETVYLIDPNNRILEGVFVDGGHEGQSFARGEDAGWAWTDEPTKNAANVVSVEEDEETASAATSVRSERSSSASKSKSGVKAAVRPASIADLRDLTKGTKVTFEGVVIAEPGTVSSQFLFVQDETAGIQVYSQKGAFPELALGTNVEVNGTISTSTQEFRVNVSSAEDIVAVGTGETTQPKDDSSLEDHDGELVSVAGELTSKTATSWKVTIDDGDEVTVKFLSSGSVEAPKLVEGQRVTVTGVVRVKKKTAELLPRSAEDIVVEKSEPVVAGAQDKAETEVINAATSTPSSPWLPVLAAGYILPLGALLYLYKMRVHKKQKNQNPEENWLIEMEKKS
ncbi:MAG: lamin tail domain-containing protein [Candidatus Kerfeldbacteria bacterium]|nr:lamin tail domain-containing protein [Candidatus Kerfeldbacteria bacterium]